ncbi:hypothetical protein [Cronobacter dublinensis]|nr:hypothetical protein [Cronobacter dublinensis]
MLKVSAEAEIKIGLEIFKKNNICENSSTSFKPLSRIPMSEAR